MLKWLAIVALALTLAQKPLPVQGHNQENKPQNKTSESSPNTPTIVAPEVGKENAENAQRYAYYKAHPKEYLHDATAPAYLSNWVLAGLGIIGGVFAFITILAIKQQATAQMTAERAWLVIGPAARDYVPRENEEPRFKWSIRNCGNTPAQITETSCMYEIVERVSLLNLPGQPDYPVAIVLKGLLLPPGDSIGHTANLIEPPRSSAVERFDKSTINILKMNMFTLRAYGYVRYIDAFGKNRESRFCQYYIWPEEGVPNPGFRPLLDAPPAYTKCT